LANDSGKNFERQVDHLYTEGHLQGRPYFTKFYSKQPSSYFPGVKAPRETLRYDLSACRPFEPGHTEFTDIPLPADYRSSQYDCSRLATTRRRVLTPEEWLSLYRITYPTTLPGNEHPYELRARLIGRPASGPFLPLQF
jgi:hypothetical protein